MPISLVASFTVTLSLFIAPLAMAATPACGSTITTNTTLDSNMSCTGTAITIAADNVVFDCADHSITGSGSGNGIDNTGGYNYTTVKNCVITGFQNGIDFGSGAGYGTIVNNTANSNSNVGINLNSSSNNKIANNTANLNSQGIFLNSSSNNTLTGNTAGNNTFGGVTLSSSSDSNAVSNNTAGNNQQSGITIWTSSNNVLTSNTTNLNSQGIFLNSSSNNTLTGNTAGNNSQRGIFLQDSNFNNRIASNTISSNLNNSVGVYINLNSKNNTVVSNTVETTGISGYDIWIGGQSSGNTIADNSLTAIAPDDAKGILIDGGSSYNTALRNSITAYDSLQNGGGIIINGGYNRIEGNNITNNAESIGLFGASNNSNVTSNTIAVNESGDGILIGRNQANITIANNTIVWRGNDGAVNQDVIGGTGITISRDNTGHSVTGNNITVYDQGAGIWLGKFSANNTISGNTISAFGGGTGGQLGGGSIGIVLASSTVNNTVSGNTIHQDGVNGSAVYLFNALGNTITNNSLTTVNDSSTGITFSGASFSTISGNTITASGLLSSAIKLSASAVNLFYNNLINGTTPVYVDTNVNNWNTAKQAGTNIIGGPFIGGNFYANASDTGFSQTCPNVIDPTEMICDTVLTFNSNNIDFLPLAVFVTIADSDDDGIANDADACPASTPDADPLGEHYSWKGGAFFKTSDPKTKALVDSQYSMLQTKGCTCAQILNKKPGQDLGQLKQGCTKGTMDNFIKELKKLTILKKGDTLWSLAREVLGTTITDYIKAAVKELADYNGINIPEWGLNSGRLDARKLLVGSIIDLIPLDKYLKR